MQKVNVDVYIWNELRSNDRFGLKMNIVGWVVFRFALHLLLNSRPKPSMQAYGICSPIYQLSA